MNAAVAPAPAQPTETASKPGRPEILDDIAKTKVLGLVELGHSRRAKLIELRGGNIILEQFSQKEDEQR